MQEKKMGLFICCAVVAGNMMGSGVAMLPTAMAAIGSITVYSWIIAIIGAVGLAYVFARLGAVDPQEGGPVAYAGKVSPILGFQAQTLYFHANWIGNLAIAITSISYLSPLVPILKDPVYAGVAIIAEIWILTIVNIIGAAWIGRLASFGFILVMIPVMLTGLYGWFFFDHSTFVANWDIGHKASFSDIVAGVLLCIWSFIGVESASVNTNLVENPSRNIPLSTIIGVIIAAAFYLLSNTAIFGMFPAADIAASNAPFAMTLTKMFAPWTGTLVSVFTAVACFTSLGSWMMLVAQAGARASHDGNLPKVFGKLSAGGQPIQGLIYTSCFMTVLVGIMTLYHQNTIMIFNEIISIAVLLTVIPYFYSALYLIQITEHSKRGLVQIISSLIAILFCFAGIYGASKGALIGTVLVSFAVLVFYEFKDKDTLTKVK